MLILKDSREHLSEISWVYLDGDGDEVYSLTEKNGRLVGILLQIHGTRLIFRINSWFAQFKKRSPQVDTVMTASKDGLILFVLAFAISMGVAGIVKLTSVVLQGIASKGGK